MVLLLLLVEGDSGDGGDFGGDGVDAAADGSEVVMAAVVAVVAVMGRCDSDGDGAAAGTAVNLNDKTSH